MKVDSGFGSFLRAALPGIGFAHALPRYLHGPISSFIKQSCE